MTPQEHANAVWRAEASPESLAGAITAYTEEIRGELHRARTDHAAEVLIYQANLEAVAKDSMLEIDSLARDRDILTAENAALREEVDSLRAKDQFSKRELARGNDIIDQLRADLTAARARIAELEGVLKAARNQAESALKVDESDNIHEIRRQYRDALLSISALSTQAPGK